MNYTKSWSSVFVPLTCYDTYNIIQHRWIFCCLHIYSFNALPQALPYSSIKRGGFELPCSILFGLAHIDETRGLKRVYETALGSWFGESSNFNHMKGPFMSIKQKLMGWKKCSLPPSLYESVFWALLAYPLPTWLKAWLIWNFLQVKE